VTAIHTRYGIMSSHSRDQEKWVQRKVGTSAGTIIELSSDYANRTPFKAEVFLIDKRIDMIILKTEEGGDPFLIDEKEEKITLARHAPKNLETFVMLGYDIGGERKKTTIGRVTVDKENSKRHLLIDPATNPGESGAGAINTKGLVIGMNIGAREIPVSYSVPKGADPGVHSINSMGYGDVAYLVSCVRIREALETSMRINGEEIPAEPELEDPVESASCSY